MGKKEGKSGGGWSGRGGRKQKKTLVQEKWRQKNEEKGEVRSNVKEEKGENKEEERGGGRGGQNEKEWGIGERRKTPSTWNELLN